MTTGARILSLPCPQGPLLIALVMEYAPTPCDVVTSMHLYIPQAQSELHIGGQMSITVLPQIPVKQGKRCTLERHRIAQSPRFNKSTHVQDSYDFTF